MQIKQTINCFEFDTNYYVTSIYPLMLKKKLRKKRNKTVELGINSENEHDTDSDNEYEEPVLKSTQFSSSNSSIVKSITENIIYYISGYIVKKLKSVMCYSCVTNLRAAECEHNYLRKNENLNFLLFPIMMV